MSDQPLCPNAPVCNFHRIAAASDDAALRDLTRAYCCDPARNGTCFRSMFLQKRGSNLSSDIGPNATLLRGMAEVLPPSDLATDQAARIFATS